MSRVLINKRYKRWAKIGTATQKKAVQMDHGMFYPN